MNNNKTTNILLGILIAVVIVIGIFLIKKPNKAMNKNPQITNQATENKIIKKDLVCESFELEGETCVLVGAKFPIETGEAVYDQGEYYGFYQDREIEASVHIYKASAFNCIDVKNVFSCDERTKTTLVKNDDTSKASFVRIIKYLTDTDYQLNGGHQY